METLAAQPPIAEQFDYYLRKYNDATTWLAETLDGAMRTPFEYTFDGRELYASDGGCMGEVFRDSLYEARELARRQPGLAFELRRRQLELEEYGAMIRMARGELPNTMIVISDFPAELMQATQDVGGYNVGRKQTMLRVLTWQYGRLHMVSQSLDGSNRQALEAIYAQFGVKPRPGELLGQRLHIELPVEEQESLADRLTGVYDRSLAGQFGGAWHAGRPEVPHDTYRFVLSQRELIDRFVTQEMHGGVSPTDRYNIAALLAKRFDDFKRPNITVHEAEIVFGGLPRNLEWELQQAGQAARLAGKSFNGCGISASADPQSAQGQLEAAGYGNQSGEDEDKYGSLEFTCSKGHRNRRPYGKLIDNCRTCGISVKC